MNCQFQGCPAEASHEILYGVGQNLSLPICIKHMADTYCQDPVKYSGCRFLPLGADRTPRVDPHVAVDPEKVPISGPPEGAGCGGCRGCK